MVTNQGHTLSGLLQQRGYDDAAGERALICSGQALSTRIVVPQIGLPLFFM